jgi:hypothetical protein
MGTCYACVEKMLTGVAMHCFSRPIHELNCGPGSKPLLQALLGRSVVSAGTNLEWRNANANEHDVHEFKRVEDQWTIGDELFRNAAVAPE